MKFDIKSEVSGGKLVRFQYYRAHELWYRTESGFMFPVPESDIGDATFLAEDRAMLFMRYIRKYAEQMEKAEVARELCPHGAEPVDCAMCALQGWGHGRTED